MKTTAKPAAPKPPAASKRLTKAETDALVGAAKNARRYLSSLRSHDVLSGPNIDGVLDSLAAALKAAGK